MTPSIYTGLAACLLYLGSLSLQVTGLRDRPASRRQLKTAVWLGLPALALHFGTVALSVYSERELNIGLFNAASLLSAVATALIWAASLRWPLRNLLLFTYPATIVVLLTSLFVPLPARADIELNWGIGLHILFSIIGYSILAIAAVQACAVALLIRQLKHHQFHGAIKHLPPLQTMETLLFGLIWTGEIFVGLAIATGAIFLEDMLAQHLAHKTILSIMGWSVFAILLWGRHIRGWRGSTAIRWTLSGFALLILAYFGSKFVLEIVLS